MSLKIGDKLISQTAGVPNHIIQIIERLEPNPFMNRFVSLVKIKIIASDESSYQQLRLGEEHIRAEYLIMSSYASMHYIVTSYPAIWCELLK